jgi:hypothetical protein
MNPTLRKPALVALVVVLLIGTAGALLLRGSDKSPGDSKSDKQRFDSSTAQVADTPAAEQNSKAATPTRSALDSKAAQERHQLLETIGTLTGAHCYQTYLNIGLIADGKAKGTYSEKDASKVLESVLSLHSSVDRNLSILAKMELDKQDRDNLEQMRDLSALLRQQGKELKAFWDGGKEEDATKYENARKDSWAAIGRITGIGR